LQLFGIFQFIRRITYYYESLIGLIFKGIIAPFQLEYFLLVGLKAPLSMKCSTII
jgi:hypothetical protein